MDMSFCGMTPFVVLFGLSANPGEKTAELSTPTLSRPFCPSPKPESTDAITITGGTYQLKVDGVWGALTADAGTWGTATAAKVSIESSGAYETPVSAVMTIGGIDYTFTVTTRAADIICDPFTFDPVYDVLLNTLTESNEITVAGIEIDVPITVVDLEYQINGGAWTSAEGTVSLNDVVKVRRLSSVDENLAETSGTLYIGTVSGVFTITTEAYVDRVDPSIPAGLTAVATGASTVDVSWEAATDNDAISHYILRRDDVVIGGNIEGLSYADSGLTDGTGYSYTIEAVDTSDNTSGQSSAALVTTDPLPVLLWNAEDGLVSETGGTWQYEYAGPQYDDSGLSVGAVPVKHYNVDGSLKGYWGGPAYANILPSLSFTLSGGTATTGIVDPDGGTGAYALTESATTSAKWIAPSSVSGTSFVAGATYIMPQVIKMSGRRFVQLTGSGGAFGSSQYANFDLQEGAITAVVGCTAGITPLGDGWFLCWLRVVATNTVSVIGNIVCSITAGDSTRVPSIAGINGEAFKVWQPMTIAGTNRMPYVPPTTSVVSAAGTSSDNGMYLPMTTDVSAALNTAAQFALATLVTVGVSSANLSSDANILSTDNAVVKPLCFGASATIKAGDGTNTATVTVVDGWAEGETIGVTLRSTTNGTKLQVGYIKSSETEITWGTEVDFTGSLGTEPIRLAYNSVIPIWNRHLQIWDTETVDDSELILRLNEA